MAKPPASPPSSDIGGVHQHGTRPSKPLDSDGQGGEDLARAARQDVARPDYSGDRPDHGDPDRRNKEARDDRTS